MQADTRPLRHVVHEHLLRTTPSATLIDASVVASAVGAVAPLLDHFSFDRLVQEVLSDVHGLGPLEPLMADSSVTDVMVVGGRGIWIERDGCIVETSTHISSDEVAHLIERIVAPLGLRIDRASPMIDARLPDGSRVNAVVPPLAIDGPCLTIRRFGARHISLTELASKAIASLLEDAVASRMNILVTGGTGSGKTTLLNALAQHLGETERVVTVEDAAELRLPLRHVVRLEGRPANTEGVGAVGLRDLVRNALRMRPDRIIVGEVRGPEALDMLQAMNTGHEGSMSTCHANSALDALRRIETMVLMGDVPLPLSAVRQQMEASIDLIVHIARQPNGMRRVVEVCEVGNGSETIGVRSLAVADRIVASPLRAAVQS